MAENFVTDPSKLSETAIPADAALFGEGIAWDDHKIAYAVRYAEGRDVLDVGCVEHDPENYRSPYWLHKALAEKAKSLRGLDLSKSGVEFLQARGFDISHGDAQNFDFEQDFDVIVAGDLVEHLEDLGGFLRSVKRNLRAGGVLVVSTPNPWYWRNVVKSGVKGGIVANNPEHTCWLDPVTFGQLAARHGMELDDIRFGSRFARDRLMPLPKGIKHTSWHCAVRVTG